MIVTSEVKKAIKHGATFAVMRHSKNKRLDIYWIKYPSYDGIELPLRTGRYVEKTIKPVEWAYDP